MPTIVNPPGWPSPSGYSNGLAYDEGRVLFIAGQVGWDETGRLVSEELAPQFAQALRNIVAVVRAAGGEPEHIGRFLIFVKDKQDYLASTKAIGHAYREVMGKHYPAMSLVQVADLLLTGARVEIEATAVLP